MTDTDDKILQAARGLATEVSPERDLWPAIAASLTVPRAARKSRWSPLLAQAAAAVLLVGASSLLTYIVVTNDANDSPPQVVQVPAPVGLTFERVAFGGQDTLASVYGRASGNVGTELDSELASLSPEAREDVRRNLAVIHHAIDEIAAALEKEPDNVSLQELLVATYGREVALMNRVGSMAQRVLARKDI